MEWTEEEIGELLRSYQAHRGTWPAAVVLDMSSAYLIPIFYQFSQSLPLAPAPVFIVLPGMPEGMIYMMTLDDAQRVVKEQMTFMRTLYNHPPNLTH